MLQSVKNMKVSIHQPAYLPWLGYFDRIAKSDLFIFLDNVQFEKNSYTNRNIIKGPNGPQWLTIPIKQKGHLNRKLYEIEIATDIDWRSKHLKSIKHCYARAEGFNEKYEKILSLYDSNEKNLSNLCFTHLCFWLNELNIETPIIRASNLITTEKKSDLVLELCSMFNATDYLSGPMGKNYLDEVKFNRHGIIIHYHHYQPHPYGQLFGSFVPFMGVVDYWFNQRDKESNNYGIF